MADARRLSLAELRETVSDAEELAKGTRLGDTVGALAHLARYANKLYADAAGSGASPYKVQILFEESGTVRGRCSCMAARSRPFCKHAAALLVAWARAPESFAVADVAPAPAPGEGKKRAVKTGKAKPKDLMARGVEQASALVRELAVSGVASLAADRVDQVRALGESLREARLRRLSARTLELAEHLERAVGRTDAFDASDYAELFGDLLLTVRKLEKHLGGEPLANEHVEELIGKTWTKKDRRPLEGSELVEYGFAARTTPDDFAIRESRYFDLASGEHYAEKQILPTFLAQRTDPKRSWAGRVLVRPTASIYPSFAPQRLDLEGIAPRPLVAPDLARLLERALPDVGTALAALQARRKDVFAPEALPVALRAGAVLAEGGRMQVVDAQSAALFLPEDAALEAELASALRGATLEALLGDLVLDGALPTLVPLAAVVRADGTLALARLAGVDVAALLQSRKVRAVEAGGPVAGASRWADVARRVGASTAAIALGEVREEMALALATGLPGVTPRTTEALVSRLRELGLGKQAELLAALAARAEAADKLDDFVKLHQVLAIALARLAGATHVDRAALVPVPCYESVFVRAPERALTPAEVAALQGRGAINRYEAAAYYARHYDALSPAELAASIYPTWADGSASPYIARAFAKDPDTALACACRVLGHARASEAKVPLWRVLLGMDGRPRPAVPGAHARVARLTALRVLAAVGSPEARELLKTAAASERDPALAAHARRALAGRGGAQLPEEEQEALDDLVSEAFDASHKEERSAALRRLADLGAIEAIPAMRASLLGDISGEVREAAAFALARVGDIESVDTFLRLLRSRAADPANAKVAAQALGLLGDVRGIEELLVAYAEGWQPGVVADALRQLGLAALDPLVTFIESRPEILERKAALGVIAAFPEGDLVGLLTARLDAIAAEPDFCTRAAICLAIAGAQPGAAVLVAKRVVELRPALLDRTQGSREERALAKRCAKYA
ncbi:MAG: HEAT repeat domain-containing protein [Myxococcales bacterium]|nr:HEAT repeat domain-containing protein [Myxococcales bacterium]